MSATTEKTVVRTAHNGRTFGTITGAVVAAVVPWTIAQVFHTDLEVTMPGQPPMVIGLPFVAMTALLAALAGWGSFAILRRLTSRARGIWTALATAALLLSFGPVLTVDTTTGVRVTLALMHIAVAAVLIPGLRRSKERS